MGGNGTLNRGVPRSSALGHRLANVAPGGAEPVKRIVLLPQRTVRCAVFPCLFLAADGNTVAGIGTRLLRCSGKQHIDRGAMVARRVAQRGERIAPALDTHEGKDSIQRWSAEIVRVTIGERERLLRPAARQIRAREGFANAVVVVGI